MYQDTLRCTNGIEDMLKKNQQNSVKLLLFEFFCFLLISHLCSSSFSVSLAKLSCSQLSLST